MYNSVSQALFTQLDFKNVPPPPSISFIKIKIQNKKYPQGGASAHIGNH